MTLPPLDTSTLSFEILFLSFLIYLCFCIRLQLTDGTDALTGMLATQFNDLVQNGSLCEFAIVKMKKFMMNEVKGQKLLIVLDIEVIGRESGPLQSSAPAAPQAVHVPPQTVPPRSVPSMYGNPPPAVQQTASLYGSAPQQSLYGQQPQPQTSYHSVPAASTSIYGAGGYGGQVNRQPVVRTETAQTIVPIESLNPYMNKWTFKARITAKSEIRSWSNARGQGTLFSIDLLDAKGTEIKGTFFKDACDKYYPLLEEGKGKTPLKSFLSATLLTKSFLLPAAYTFSGGKINPVKDKKWSALKNDYEITFDANSVIEPAADDADIKVQSYHFIKIATIADLEVNTTVDVIGILRSVGDAQELVSKASGKALRKRDIVLTDDSGFDVRVTLWGEKANVELSPEATPVVAVKGAKVGEYQGKNLSSLGTTMVVPNPDIPEGHELYRWKSQFKDALPAAQSMSTGGGDRAPDSIDKRKTVSCITDERLGLGDKPDFVSVKGSVSFIKHDQDDGPWYTACPGDGCNKKVTQSMGDTWQCEKCARDYMTCNRRYILTASLADHTGTHWISLFDEAAQLLLGHTAEELHQMKVAGDDASYERVFSDALFKQYVAKLRVKQEMVNDEPRLKSTALSMTPINFAAESKQLLHAIALYN